MELAEDKKTNSEKVIANSQFRKTMLESVEALDRADSVLAFTDEESQKYSIILYQRVSSDEAFPRSNGDGRYIK